MTELYLITGERGEGKTTWCQALVERLRREGGQVCGVLSPAVFENGEKVGIDIVDLETGERRRLANRGRLAEERLEFHWSMQEAALDWANQILRKIADCEVLILDELGPLEFELQGGLHEGLTLLDEGRADIAYAVVRPRLLANAQARWPGARVVKIGDAA